MEKNPNTGLSDNLETVGEGADGIYEMIFQEIDDAVFLLEYLNCKELTHYNSREFQNGLKFRSLCNDWIIDFSEKSMTHI